MKHLDEHCVNHLRQEHPDATPCLLVDGHQTRFSLELQECINDPAHLWKCALGVPCASDVWQAGDAPQCNGRIAVETAKRKRTLMKVKRRLGMKPVLKLTDVPPLVNWVCDIVFQDPSQMEDALFARGLLHPNCCLLATPEVLSAKDLVDIGLDEPAVIQTPEELCPDALPTSMEELRAMIDRGCIAGRKDERVEGQSQANAAPLVDNALALVQPMAHQIVISLHPDARAGDIFRQLLQKADLEAARRKTKELGEEGDRRQQGADKLKKMVSGTFFRTHGIDLSSPDLLEHTRAFVEQTKSKLEAGAVKRAANAKTKLSRVRGIRRKKKWVLADWKLMVGSAKPPGAKDNNGKSIAPSKLKTDDLKALWSRWKTRLPEAIRLLRVEAAVDHVDIDSDDDSDDDDDAVGGGGDDDNAEEEDDDAMDLGSDDEGSDDDDDSDDDDWDWIRRFIDRCNNAGALQQTERLQQSIYVRHAPVLAASALICCTFCAIEIWHMTETIRVQWRWRQQLSIYFNNVPFLAAAVLVCCTFCTVKIRCMSEITIKPRRSGVLLDFGDWSWHL